jgi:hypothetical protein
MQTFLDEVLALSPSFGCRMSDTDATARDVMGGTSGSYVGTYTQRASGLIVPDADAGLALIGASASGIRFAKRTAINVANGPVSGVVWVKPTSYTSTPAFMDWGSGALVFRFADTSGHTLLRRNSFTTLMTSVGTVPLNAISMLGFSYNGGTTTKLYKATVGTDLTAQDISSGSPSSSTCVDNAINFSFGAADDLVNNLFQGIIDEGYVFKSILAQADFTALFQAGTLRGGGVMI